MKDFKQEFEKFEEMIKNHQPFAISRNNDGEMSILFDEFIDLMGNISGEFIYDPKLVGHQFFRKKLQESAQYKADNYYVGIACRCCVGDEKHEKLKALTGQDEEHLTWGNIFINSNYPLYVQKILPEYSNYKVIMVVNDKAVIDQLPFNEKIVRVFRVGANAWMKNYDLINEIKKYIEDNKTEEYLFLFAAGPFSNILVHECFKSSPNNTYLDIGSTLDPFIGFGATRGYLQGARTLEQTCIW